MGSSAEWTKWYEGQNNEHKKFYEKIEAEILKKKEKDERINALDIFLLHELRYTQPPSDSGIDRTIILGPESFFSLIFQAEKQNYSKALTHYIALVNMEKQLNELKLRKELFDLTFDYSYMTGLDGRDDPEYEYKTEKYKNLILEDWYFQHKPDKNYVEYSSQLFVLNISSDLKKEILKFSVRDYRQSFNIKIYKPSEEKLLTNEKPQLNP